MLNFRCLIFNVGIRGSHRFHSILPFPCACLFTSTVIQKAPIIFLSYVSYVPMWFKKYHSIHIPVQH